MLKVLQRAQELCSGEESKLREALASASEDLFQDLQELQLSFCASISDECSAPMNGKFATSLDLVLQQRRALLEGRQKGWPALRSAYLQVELYP